MSSRSSFRLLLRDGLIIGTIAVVVLALLVLKLWGSVAVFLAPAVLCFFAALAYRLRQGDSPEDPP